MRTVLLLAAFGLFVGCARKGAKDTAPARDDLTKVKAQQPQPAANGDKKSDKADAPNWLKTEQQKKDQLPVDGSASSGKQPWGVGPPQGGFTGPVAGVQPAQPLAGGVPGAQNPPAAAVEPNTPAPAGGAKRAVTKDDMFNLQVFIHDSSLVRGRMPTAAEIYAALVEAKSPAAELVKDGTIILTGAKARESVWAFDAGAYANGGLAVSQNGVETLTAAELKQRLGK